MTASAYDGGCCPGAGPVGYGGPAGGYGVGIDGYGAGGYPPPEEITEITLNYLLLFENKKTVVIIIIIIIIIFILGTLIVNLFTKFTNSK